MNCIQKQYFSGLEFGKRGYTAIVVDAFLNFKAGIGLDSFLNLFSSFCLLGCSLGCLGHIFRSALNDTYSLNKQVRTVI